MRRVTRPLAAFKAALCVVLLLSAEPLILEAAGQSATYTLGPDDQLVLRGLNAEEITNAPVTIDSTGDINLPLVGRLHAAGLSVRQLEAALNERLKQFLLSPDIAVTVAEFRSQPVSVLGAVNSPGIYQLRGQKTLLDVLSLAGGLRADAGSAVKISRSVERGPLTLSTARLDQTATFNTADVSVGSLMEARNPQENITILASDVITVPRAQMIYVVGDVRKSGGFLLGERENLSLLQALSLAEGLAPGAAPSAARILRAVPNSATRIEVPVDLKKTLAGKTPDIPLSAEDILFVPGSVAAKTTLRVVEAAIQLGTGLAIYRGF